MTCVVGITNGSSIFMGADSAGADVNWNLTVRRDSKVFVRDPYVIGFTTSFRMGQILAYAAEIPLPPEGANLHEFMCTKFVDAIRAAFSKGGWMHKESEREQGGCFLVGVNGQLFTVESDFQVGHATEDYAAVGCGECYALGALYALRKSDLPERKKIRAALEAAEHGSAGVRRPFVVVEL